jgi:uncharacterized protein YndB with AHSA1/START domain
LAPGETLQMTTPADSGLAVTRQFHVPRERVFEALTDCAPVKQWLGVFGDWSIARCEIDLRAGGRSATGGATRRTAPRWA